MFISEQCQSTGVFITGLAHQHPPNVIRQEDFESILQTICADHVDSQGIRKLIAVNRNTGISSRSVITDYSKHDSDCSEPPSISDLSSIFRTAGVDLATTACRKALLDADLCAADITHTVAVTCTDTGNPGYDLFVNQKLGVGPGVDRVLLHGVGCAGGLAALRTAANLAAAATLRRQKARVLVMSCELCSLYTLAELNWACQDPSQTRITPALFSDAAAAVIICNELGLRQDSGKAFELLDWRCRILEGTMNCMSMLADPLGYRTTLSKKIPEHTAEAVSPMFNEMRKSFSCASSTKKKDLLRPRDCDWAIHTGGAAILDGVQRAMNLSDDHMKMSKEIYRRYGNSSSASVLIVLDKVRGQQEGKKEIIATAFGPGLSIEMITMKRCRSLDRGRKSAVGSVKFQHIQNIMRSVFNRRPTSTWLGHKTYRLFQGCKGLNRRKCRD